MGLYEFLEIKNMLKKGNSRLHSNMHYVNTLPHTPNERERERAFSPYAKQAYTLLENLGQIGESKKRDNISYMT